MNVIFRRTKIKKNKKISRRNTCYNHCHKAGRKHTMKTANMFFKDVVKLKYFRKTLTR
jgi:hypothetical protein